MKFVSAGVKVQKIGVEILNRGYGHGREVMRNGEAITINYFQHSGSSENHLNWTEGWRISMTGT